MRRSRRLQSRFRVGRPVTRGTLSPTFNSSPFAQVSWRGCGPLSARPMTLNMVLEVSMMRLGPVAPNATWPESIEGSGAPATATNSPLTSMRSAGTFMRSNVGIDRRAPAVCRAAQASPHAFRRTAGACPCRTTCYAALLSPASFSAIRSSGCSEITHRAPRKPQT